MDFDPTPHLAKDEYFAAVVQAAEDKGLKLIGKAVIDSSSCEMRDKRTHWKTNVPLTLFKRTTILIFHKPGNAVCLAGHFTEEIDSDGESARNGHIVPMETLRHQYWNFTVILGLIPGMWWGYPEEDEKWLYIGKNQDTGKFFITTKEHSGARNDGAYPADPKGDAHDAYYRLAVGFYPHPSTPESMAEFFDLIANGTSQYVREGKFGQVAHSAPESFPPWQIFSGSEILFWQQIKPEDLLVVFTEVEVNPEWSRQNHDHIMSI